MGIAPFPLEPPNPWDVSGEFDVPRWPNMPRSWASAASGYARDPSMRTAHVAMLARPGARMAVDSISQLQSPEEPGNAPRLVRGRPEDSDRSLNRLNNHPDSANSPQ